MNHIREGFDAPLVRFQLKRLNTDKTTEYRTDSNPVVGIGNWVSMPYLIGANPESHERYQKDRLFTVLRFEGAGTVVIDASGNELTLTPDQTLVLEHDNERIEVRIAEFTSRSVLHEAERRSQHPS